MSGTITSAPARVVVTHDDVAPNAPVTASITAATPALTTCLTGRRATTVAGAASSVEGRSTVRVVNTGNSATASTAASDTGTFSTTVTACPGDVLQVTATDAAGNVSVVTNVNAT
jgi:hypothetical protein